MRAGTFEEFEYVLNAPLFESQNFEIGDCQLTEISYNGKCIASKTECKDKVCIRIDENIPNIIKEHYSRPL